MPNISTGPSCVRESEGSEAEELREHSHSLCNSANNTAVFSEMFTGFVLDESQEQGDCNQGSAMADVGPSSLGLLQRIQIITVTMMKVSDE